MPTDLRKSRYTPMEIARMLGISIAKFSELVNDGALPKGRIGEDGKRYYTDKDVAFIRREWTSKTKVKFLFFTLPLILAGVLTIIAIFYEINQHYREQSSATQPTPRIGYAAPPPELVNMTTPYPTPKPLPTSAHRSYDQFRKYRRQSERRPQSYNQPDYTE